MYLLASSLAAALLESLFEHPTGHRIVLRIVPMVLSGAMKAADDSTITRILKGCLTIAVVGLSSNPAEPSYGATSTAG
jgi:hypothetical protein